MRRKEQNMRRAGCGLGGAEEEREAEYEERRNK